MRGRLYHLNLSELCTLSGVTYSDNVLSEGNMRTIYIATILAALTALPVAANAQSDRTLSGAAIGAGAGAVVAGPVGAVVGGVGGAIVGGPSLRGRRSCWRDRNGYRHCRR
jgi:osmotically inducible lipoprotein OsmB